MYVPYMPGSPRNRVWNRGWQVDRVRQKFIKVAVDSADSVHVSLGSLLPGLTSRKKMGRDCQKGTTLITTSVQMPMYLGLGRN